MTVIEQIHSSFRESYSVSTDTRKIQRGDIFFALKGERFDANKFALSAIDAGAEIVVADNIKAIKSELNPSDKARVDSLIKDSKIIIVEDSLITLQELSSYHRDYLGTQIIAITGSNAKTTTKELTSRVLSKSFNISMTEGNLNNHIGVPLTLLKITEDTDLAIVEMGASSRGEIALLSSIAKPNFGIITNIGKAHLEGFGGQDGVRKGKGELADYLEKNGGTLFYLGDSPQLQQIADEHKDLRAIPYSTSGWTTIPNQYAAAEFEGTKYQSYLTGEYNIMNMAAAHAIGRFFGILDSDISSAIESYKPDNNRSQRVETQTNTIICDAYNANPSSMTTALDAFMSLEAESKQQVVILGGMLELGEFSQQEHREIYDKVKGLISMGSLNSAYFVGEQWPQQQDSSIMLFDDTDKLKTHITQSGISNSMILVKGSHSIALEKVFPLL